jgi:uncharacterized membrane protein YfcA
MIAVIILCIVALICLIGAVVSGWLIQKPDGPIYIIICIICIIAFFICVGNAVNKADQFEKEQQKQIHIELKR